eukprot:tig00001466_g8782.t1
MFVSAGLPSAGLSVTVAPIDVQACARCPRSRPPLALPSRRFELGPTSRRARRVEFVPVHVHPVAAASPAAPSPDESAVPPPSVTPTPPPAGPVGEERKEKKSVSSVSDNYNLERAISEACDRLAEKLGRPGRELLEVDLCLVFVNDVFSSDFERVLPLLGERVRAGVVLGCSGGGVVGCDEDGVPQELEARPSVALAAFQLGPGASLRPFHVRHDQLPSPDGAPEEWWEALGVDPGRERVGGVLLFSDPVSGALPELLAGLDFALPAAPKVGGVASWADSSTALFLNHKVRRTGTVGVALCGDVAVRSVVAQGCRPIGPSVMVTRAEGNVIHAVGEEPRGLSAGLRLELEGSVPPLDFVKDVVQRLPVDALALRGVCADPFVERPEAADFLVRDLLGVGPTGAIAVGADVRPGQRLQFFVRDAAAASAELIERLDEFTASPASEGLGQPLGALMVACMGRGEGLYGFRGHDSQLLRRALGPVPVCGFFANGEIGPVRGGATTHLHGYTTAIALIY